MEAALVSVATGALKPVLEKLGALLGEKYKRFTGVRKDIKSLTRELTHMDVFLMKMSEEEDRSEEDTLWMNEVRELSYHMEDCIDDFMQSVNDKDTKPDGFIEKMKHSLGKLGKMKTCYRIGNDIHDLKKQITEVAEMNKRYKTPVPFPTSMNAIVQPGALAMFEDASKLVGIDEPKAEIVKLLTEGASTQEQTKLVSIVGPGGLGKTTLANQVYEQLKEKFKCRAFLTVSRNPDKVNVLRRLLSEITSMDYGRTESGDIQELISKIKKILEGERYFVVVDDIWDIDTRDVIKLAFPMTSSGSIIITTTRINDVAKSCRSSFGGDIYDIKHLDDVHSRQLFHRRLFGCKEDCPSHLEKVSDQILKKCDGLPLAIITMSGLLANRERREDLWNKVKDSIGCALERNHGVRRMMKILSLSYFDLPHYLRSCLLYMVIFPEDFIIEKKYLIRRWIGEGFIHKEDNYTVYEIGERCFNELLNRGLIQASMINSYGTVKSCRVHDMILDFLISKSIEENFVSLLGVPVLTVKTQSKVVHRLSLQVSKEGYSAMQTSDVVLSHVRSLNVFRYTVEIPSLDKFRYLRVLHLEKYKHLKDQHLESIVCLFHLRYLNLKNTGISKLPERIGRLGCLEILDIRYNNIQKLPASIVDLRKLVHLFVDRTYGAPYGDGDKFPDGISKMQALEILKKVRVLQQPCDFPWSLGQLKNLTNLSLDLSANEDTHVVQECEIALVSSLCKLGNQNLCSLSIQDGSSLLQQPWSPAPLTLKKLSTFDSAVPQVPKWVSSLRNLQQLRIEVNGIKYDDLCILGALPALLILHLMSSEKSDGKLIVDDEIGFRFLRFFSYNAHCCRVGLMFAEGSMPHLETLELLEFRTNQDESLDFGIGNLPSLINVKYRGAIEEIGAVETAMKRAVIAHPKHPSLVFEYYQHGCVTSRPGPNGRIIKIVMVGIPSRFM
uniref:Uncharacterized protein n=1 Tax=Avena sativa TaxID=4498 RepID=A0ACD5ZI10_AVESA